MQEEFRRKIVDELYKEKARLEMNLSSLSLSVSQREYERRNVSNYEPDLAISNSVCCDVLTRSISQINKALVLLENHPEQYGICEFCGKFIPEDRIEALPWATSCVECVADK